MSNWRTLKIKDLGRVVTGKTPPKSEPAYYNGKFKFVSPKDMERDTIYIHKTQTTLTELALKKFKNQVIPKNSIMYTILSFGFGKIGIATEDVLTNQQITSIVVNDQHCFRFVYYLLRANTDYFFTFNSGIETPLVPKSVFEEAEVIVPDLTTQQKISNLLWSFDELIQANSQRISNLNKLAHLQYQEWFFNFKLPNRSNIEMVPCEHSDYDSIPSGWSVLPISKVATFVRGRSYSSEQLVENEGQDFLNLKCFERGGGFRRSGIKKYLGPVKAEQILRPRNILVAVTDMTQDRAIVARAARAPLNLSDQATFSMDLIKIAPKHDSDEAWIYSYLRLSGMADHVKHFANGANVLHLNPQLIMDYPILWPDEKTRMKFSKFYTQILDYIDCLEMQNETLCKIRDLILPKIITGEIVLSEPLNEQFQTLISTSSDQAERNSI